MATEFDHQGIAEFLQPRLRLFLSVDVIGSTALKHSLARNPPAGQARPSQPWFYPMATFYREFERLLLQEWNQHVTDGEVSVALGSPPVLWKGAGDELLYVKELRDHRQVFWTLFIWRKAIREHRNVLRSKWPSLDLKTAAWLAGFPLMNSEVVLRSEIIARPEDIVDDPHYWNCELLDRYYREPPQQRYMTRDFIGPSIDTGFRVSQLATARKFVLTVEAAYLFASVGTIRNERSRPKLYFDGRASLKGVFGGVPYPVFWLDMLDGDPVVAAEDVLGGPQRVAEVSTGAAINFCQAFIDENSQFIVRPYIVQDPDPLFSTMPSEHMGLLEARSRDWTTRKTTRTIEAEALQGKEPPGDKPTSPPASAIYSFIIRTTNSHPRTNRKPKKVPKKTRQRHK